MMKNWFAYALLFVVVVLATLHIEHRLSEKNIAFVSNERLFAGFDGKKELEGRLNALQSRHKQVLDSMKLVQNLIHEDMKKDLNRKIVRLSLEFENEQAELSQQYTAQIWTQLNGYVQEYAKKNDYDFVLGGKSDGSLMYASEDEDITDRILEYANEKYKGF